MGDWHGIYCSFFFLFINFCPPFTGFVVADRGGLCAHWRRIYFLVFTFFVSVTFVLLSVSLLACLIRSGLFYCVACVAQGELDQCAWGYKSHNRYFYLLLFYGSLLYPSIPLRHPPIESITLRHPSSSRYLRSTRLGSVPRRIAIR